MAWVRWALLTLLIAAATHAAALFAAPYLVMNLAMNRIAEIGGVNAWSFSPRVTPETQRIVRSSPDLAYASCAFDLSGGPVRIRVAPGADYASLSLYAANTDNFFSINDRKMGPGGAEVVLVGPGQAAPAGADPGQVVRSPTTRGIALDRRLAPTAEAFAAADAARKANNLCAPYSVDGGG